MDLMVTLNQLKAETLEKIAKSAKDGDSGLVLHASESLDNIEELIGRLKQLAAEVDTLQAKIKEIGTVRASIVSQFTPKRNSTERTNVKSAREAGRELRAEFINKLASKGINLRPYKGETIFMTKSGKRVGIAVATERQPDRWFLGLPSDSFDHAILLCKRDIGEVVEVRLPSEFFSKHGNKLSQSKGQLKFNVLRRRHMYVVQVPDTEGVDPSNFSKDYSFLN